MDQDITLWTKVEIAPPVAQALWAALHNDDDLVGDYVNLAIVGAISRLVSDLGREAWTNDEYARIMETLGDARAYVVRSEDDMVKRFDAYKPVPF